MEARVLIRFLLTVDPKKRWTADDVLESQWIQKDAAWLRTKYRENVLQHWFKSSQALDRIAHPRQQLQLQLQSGQSYLNPGVKRSPVQAEHQQNESGMLSTLVANSVGVHFMVFSERMLTTTNNH